MKVIKSTDLVIKGVLDLVLGGRIKPGDRLPSTQEIAKLTGTSVVSAREAIKKLEAVGLITVAHGTGMFLTAGAPVIEDLLEARKAMESSTAALAATRVDSLGLLSLSKLVEQLERYKGRDLNLLSDIDAQFHLAIAKIAGNRFLFKALENISTLLRYQQHSVAKVPPIMETAVSQHAEILDAIRQKDPEAARNAMLKHLTDVIRLWKSELKRHDTQDDGEPSHRVFPAAVSNVELNWRLPTLGISEDDVHI
jgi:DNA-binding FadR family transcriptional regulator